MENQHQQSAADVLDKAQLLTATGQQKTAIKLIQNLLEDQPQNDLAREQLASIYLEEGLLEDAETQLRHAIRVNPASGFEKYANLAQLLGNTREALDLSEQGLTTLSAEVASSSSESRLAELKAAQVSANCAIAELCLAIAEDSNETAVANELDSRVEAAVLTALAISEDESISQVEALCSLANLRLSQGLPVEASKAMTRIAKIINHGIELLEAVERGAPEQGVPTAMELLPAMEIRIALGKQFIEVEMWEDAIRTLKSVMWECDFNVEVWYMLAVAHWKIGRIEGARTALDNARAILQSPDGGEGILDEDMIEKLGMQLDQARTENQRPEDAQ